MRIAPAQWSRVAGRARLPSAEGSGGAEDVVLESIRALGAVDATPND
jgi:hypothetical protein